MFATATAVGSDGYVVGHEHDSGRPTYAVPTDDRAQDFYASPDEANQAAHAAIDGRRPAVYERAVALNPEYEATDSNV